MIHYKKILNNQYYLSAKKIFDKSYTDDKNYAPFSHQWEVVNFYRGNLYGIFNNKKLIGMCAWIYPLPFDNYITICDLCIDEKERNKGYGTKILKYTISQIKKTKIDTDINVDTDLKNFFEQNGFHIVEDFSENNNNYRYSMCYGKKL